MQTSTEKNDKGGIPGKVTRPIIIAPIETKTLSQCPECHGDLRYGSRDLAEGDYYWCSVCGYGPIKYPLFSGPAIKPITDVRELLGIIDADRANEALQVVSQLKRRATHNAITDIQRAHGLVGRGV